MIGACLICDSQTLSILHANEMASQLLEVPGEDLFGKDARQWLEPTVDEEGDCGSLAETDGRSQIGAEYPSGPSLKP